MEAWRFGADEVRNWKMGVWVFLGGNGDCGCDNLGACFWLLEPLVSHSALLWLRADSFRGVYPSFRRGEGIKVANRWPGLRDTW